MPNTYYVAQGLDGEQIEAALTAINGVVTPENNGKVLAIEKGKIVAKSVSEWTDAPVLEPLNAIANGDYVPESGVDGFNSVHVAVPGAGNIQPLNVTENGTYTPPSGVDGYGPVTVNVSGENIAPIIIEASPMDYSSAYLRMYNPDKSVLNPKWSIPFELGITFLQTATHPSSQVLFGPTSGYVSAPTFEIQGSITSNAFWFGISDGSSQAYTSMITQAEFPITTNKWMFMKMFYDGTVGGVTVTDGENTITKSQNLSFTPTSSQPEFQLGGIGKSSNHIARNVLFDMGNTYFKQNGTLIWGAERGSLPS